MLADHQQFAVARVAELLDRYGGAILADDVGLGKSLVAAAVAARCDYDVDVIVPATLVAQWRATLADADVEARILTHDALLADPFVPDPAKPRLVIVDEAHAFRNPKTQRYDALARRTVGARVLLVTATPLCNRIGDLEALLALLVADDALATIGVPSIDVAFARRDAELLDAIVSELVIRRDRSVLPPHLRFGELERRVLRHPVLDIGAHVEALGFPLVGDHGGLLRRFLWRRLESSEAALLESLRRQLRFYERALGCLATGRALPKRDYRRAFGAEEDRDVFQEVLFWELFAPPTGDVVNTAEVRAEVARIEELRRVVEASPCEKRRILVELARETREPMLIFTGSAATAYDLFTALRGIRRAGVVTARERRLGTAVLHAFQRGELDAIVATDLASEGLNLQAAGVVVHYDIPWNPVKLDQRNGRAWRIGQTRSAVRAIYFLPDRDETRIVQTIAAKNRTRRRVLRAGVVTNERVTPTLRPRVARDAAIVRFAKKVAAPELLARRHKVGIERLMLAMSGEYLDQKRVDELLSLVSFEPASGAASVSAPLRGSRPETQRSFG